MADLHWSPAYQLAAMVRHRELKPSELMQATLTRIHALNPRINAFCALRAEQALAEARALDEMIARGGEIGPLAGLPLGVKDLEGVAGMATTFGSVPLDHHPTKLTDASSTILWRHWSSPIRSTSVGIQPPRCGLVSPITDYLAEYR